MDTIALFIKASDQIWGTIGGPVELVSFVMGTIVTILSALIYLIGIKILLSDELTKWVFLGYVPIGIIVITDKNKERFLMCGKVIKKEGEEYTVWTIPQGEIDVDNLRLAFERIMQRELSLEIDQYDMSRQYKAVGTIRIKDLEPRPINHPGFSIRNKSKPIGKGYYYVHAKVKTLEEVDGKIMINGLPADPTIGFDKLAVAQSREEAISMVVDSHSNRGERERKKMNQTVEILKSI